MTHSFLTVGSDCYVYTGRGWRKGVLVGVGGPKFTAWVRYKLSGHEKTVLVTDERHLRPSKGKRPEVKPPAARQQTELF